MNTYKIRKAEESEVDSYVQWAQPQGWEVGASFTKNLYKEFPDGWFVGEISEGSSGDNDKTASKIISKFYCLKYSTGIGFIGYFMVKDEGLCEKGYGAQLLQHALDNYLFPSSAETSINPCRAVGVFSNELTLPLYKEFGFKTTDKAIRLSGFVIAFPLENIRNEHHPGHVVHITDENLEEVCQFDLEYSKAYRPGFWKNWGTNYLKEHCLLFKNRKGITEGVGALRPTDEHYYIIGPIYAKNCRIAELIFHELCLHLPPGEQIILEAFESHTPAVNLFKRLGLQEVRQSCFMWKGDVPQDIVGRIPGTYAIASLGTN